MKEKDGFYVPERHTVHWNPDGTVARVDGPGRVMRQRAFPGAMDLPQTTILTPHTEMSMKFMIEISRGCPCMCRFCWAGYNYLPVRGFSRAAIVERAKQVRAFTDKIGLVSTAVCDHPEINGIVDDLSGLGFQVSVASLRLDDLSPEFVFKLVDTGVEGLTLAPECGSDRMRRVLNKQFTNEDILARARWIFENGIQNLKLYYMVGLPFETHADVEAIVTLTEQIREIMLDVGRPRGRIGRIHPSVNPFVPKPGTPFQWLRMENVKETDDKLQYLRKAFARIPNVEAICKSARTGFHQTILALGDRRVADALEYAVLNDCDLKRATKAVGLDPAFYVYRGEAEGRSPALGHHRQRGQPRLLLEGTGQVEERGPVTALPGDPRLHPLRSVRGPTESLVPAAREVEGPRNVAALPEGEGDPSSAATASRVACVHPGRWPGALGIAAMSTLPPLIRTPTFLPRRSTRPDRAAVAASAPVGSTTIFMRSHR